VVLGGPAVLAVVGGYAQGFAWWLDLLAHFRWHLALVLAVAIGLGILGKPRWPTVVYAVGLLLAIVPLLAYLPIRGESHDRGLSVVHANLDRRPIGPAFVEFACDADLILLQEVTPELEIELESAFPGHRLLAAVPRPDTRGVAALVKDGLDASADVLYPTSDADRPMLDVRLQIDTAPVSILSFHTTRPAPGKYHRWQKSGYDAAIVWSVAQRLTGRLPVVIGDFNATEQGNYLRGLKQRASLESSLTGRGLQGSWPARLPASLRLPINTALHDSRLDTLAFDVGPDLGGDHLPVRVRLAPGPDAPAVEAAGTGGE
jgi:endonuclease/exonuclease/phosphatase family metal-dependent hydrolase